MFLSSLRLRRFAFRALPVFALLAVLSLPLLALGAFQRVAVVRAQVPFPSETQFGITASAYLDNGKVGGTAWIGPPAAPGKTYFQGNATSIQNTAEGLKLIYDGTFGTPNLKARRQVKAYITLKDGMITASVPDEYEVGPVKPKSGQVTVIADAVPPTTTQ